MPMINVHHSLRTELTFHNLIQTLLSQRIYPVLFCHSVRAVLTFALLPCRLVPPSFRHFFPFPEPPICLSAENRPAGRSLHGDFCPTSV